MKNMLLILCVVFLTLVISTLLIGIYEIGLTSKPKINLSEKLYYFIGYSQGKVAKLQGKNICEYVPSIKSDAQMKGFIEGNIGR